MGNPDRLRNPSEDRGGHWQHLRILQVLCENRGWLQRLVRRSYRCPTGMHTFPSSLRCDYCGTGWGDFIYMKSVINSELVWLVAVNRLVSPWHELTFVVDWTLNVKCLSSICLSPVCLHFPMRVRFTEFNNSLSLSLSPYVCLCVCVCVCDPEHLCDFWFCFVIILVLLCCLFVCKACKSAVCPPYLSEILHSKTQHYYYC